MVVLHPPILPRFQAAQLVSRRTFVFARAGFGKSNLIKLLFSRLYAGSPVLPSRNGPAPVGTIIFDPDGEYFWPDSGGRPGLADVAALTERTVVFTSQQPPSPAYGSFVVDCVKLDIRQLSAQRVIGIALPADRQDQQNVTKLKSLGPDRWSRLVRPDRRAPLRGRPGGGPPPVRHQDRERGIADQRDHLQHDAHR